MYIVIVIQGERDVPINSCGTPEFMAPEVSLAISSNFKMMQFFCNHIIKMCPSATRARPCSAANFKLAPTVCLVNI